MINIKKINDELTIADQITFEQFQQIAEEGIKSVLNLRLLDRPFLHNEQQYMENLGLCYVNVPLDREAISPEIALGIIQQMNELPKPALVYCSNAMLAVAMVLMHIAIRQGETLQQAFQRAEGFGLFQPQPSSNFFVG